MWAVGELGFRPRKGHNNPAADQPKTAMKEAAEAGATTNGTVTAEQTAVVAEVIETSTTETLSAVVVAVTVTETVAAAAAANAAATVHMMVIFAAVVHDFIGVTELPLSSTHLCGKWLLHLKLQFVKTLTAVLDLLEIFEMAVHLLDFLILFLEAFSYHPKKVSYLD